MEIDRETVSKFRQRLDLFIFFHLGADAQVSVEEGAGALLVSIAHRRVEPFSLQVAFSRVHALLNDSRGVENFMLEQLMPHRR